MMWCLRKRAMLLVSLAGVVLGACGDDGGSSNSGSDAGGGGGSSNSGSDAGGGGGSSNSGSDAGGGGGSSNSGSDAGTDSGGGAQLQGDGIRGGALYDAWWAVTNATAPSADHPLWAQRPDTTSNARTGADTWRCKECHGWDYEGVDGAYGSGSHRTGFPGVLNSALDADAIVALLADPQGHDYGSVLADQDLADLAAFITDYVVDTSTYINPDGSFAGDATAGQAVFDNSCVACHGPEGLNTTVAGAEPGFEDFPGLIATDNPQEFLHKIRFGQPGTAMPPLAATMPESLDDLGAYAQTLPQSP